MEFLTKSLLLYCVIGFLIIPSIIMPIVYSEIFYSYGEFQLYLFTYVGDTNLGSLGIQHDEYWFYFELLDVVIINCTAHLQQTETNGILSFTPDVPATFHVVTNMNNLRVQINDIVSAPIVSEYTFDFQAGDTVKFLWRVSNPLYSFIIGLVGVALFIINPILSYKLSNNAQDKFKFLFILMGIGLVSLGLSLSFVYGV